MNGQSPVYFFWMIVNLYSKLVYNIIMQLYYKSIQGGFYVSTTYY